MDLTNPSNWSVIFEQRLQATFLRQHGEGEGSLLVYEPIDPVSVSLGTPVGLVKLFSPTAKDSWFFGCYLNAFLQIANQKTRVFSQKCSLRSSTPIYIPNYGVVPYEIEFRIPKWIDDITIVLYQFTDQSGRYVEASQQAIMSAIEVVEQRELELQTQLLTIERQVETVIDLTGTRDFTINVE